MALLRRISSILNLKQQPHNFMRMRNKNSAKYTIEKNLTESESEEENKKNTSLTQKKGGFFKVLAGLNSDPISPNLADQQKTTVQASLEAEGTKVTKSGSPAPIK